MACKKVNLQWITNDSTRHVMYNKRSKVLIKKASELARLCGVKVCVVVYGEGKTQPEVWPSIPEARWLLNRFKAMPDLQSLRKMLNQEDFLRGRISKLHDQLCKSDRENREREASCLLHETMVGCRPGLVGITIKELTSLSWMVERKMRNSKERLQQLVGGQGPCPKPPLPLQPLQPTSSSTQLQDPYTFAEMQTLAQVEEHPRQPQQPDWFADLAQNGGELSSVVCKAFTSSSSGCAGPSGSVGDMMQSYNPGSSGFSWPWDPFSPME